MTDQHDPITQAIIDARQTQGISTNRLATFIKNHGTTITYNTIRRAENPNTPGGYSAKQAHTACQVLGIKLTIKPPKPPPQLAETIYDITKNWPHKHITPKQLLHALHKHHKHWQKTLTTTTDLGIRLSERNIRSRRSKKPPFEFYYRTHDLFTMED